MLKKHLSFFLHKHRLTLTVAFVFVLAFQWSGVNYWDRSWHTRWYITETALLAACLWFLKRELDLCVVLGFGWAALSGLRVAGFARNGYPKDELIHFMAVSGGSLAWVCLALLCVLVVVPRLRLELERAWTWLCLGLSLFVCLTRASGMTGFQSALYLGNSSMNGCLIACLYPLWLHFVLEEGKPWPKTIRVLTLALPLGAIFLTDASQPLAIVAGTTLAYSWPRIPAFWRWPAGLTIVVGFFMAGLLAQGTEFLNANGRVEIYQIALDYWRANANPWTGFGLGTGLLLIPKAQQLAGYNPKALFLFLHSDWLQVLFELGVLGLALSLWIFGAGIRAATDRPGIFAAWIGCGLTGLLNYPLRVPTHAFLILSLVGILFGRKMRPEFK